MINRYPSILNSSADNLGVDKAMINSFIDCFILNFGGYRYVFEQILQKLKLTYLGKMN